ncbi:MAG: formylglycine-generating enzyme family protein [Opitutaceae bacterium]|jgi:formylglycine-generating enzyme required for sulfatase activity
MFPSPRSLLLALTLALLVSARAADLDLGGGVQLKLAPVPAGKFLMGSPKGDAGAAYNESDRLKQKDYYQHEVTLTRDFLIGATEVTQAQYRLITGLNPSVFKGDTLPVDNISWNDAVKFCELISAKTGKTVRLPTEAEWEYACRAGTITRYYFGDDPDHTTLADHAWYESNSTRETHPVGQKKPNAWGLHDMGGNVWEWCSDVFKGPYKDKTVTDPKGPPTGEIKVLRGGCWETGPLSCRSANRGGIIASRATSRFGFRIIVEVK